MDEREIQETVANMCGLQSKNVGVLMGRNLILIAVAPPLSHREKVNVLRRLDDLANQMSSERRMVSFL